MKSHSVKVEYKNVLDIWGKTLKEVGSVFHLILNILNQLQCLLVINIVSLR